MFPVILIVTSSVASPASLTAFNCAGVPSVTESITPSLPISIADSSKLKKLPSPCVPSKALLRSLFVAMSVPTLVLNPNRERP